MCSSEQRARPFGVRLGRRHAERLRRHGTLDVMRRKEIDECYLSR
jgi:hypothetical protein